MIDIDLREQYYNLRKVLDARTWFTFTPTLTNVQVASSTCLYTRIGKVYYAQWNITVVSSPSASSSILTTTLPESISNDMPSGVMNGWGMVNTGAGNQMVYGVTSSSVSTINFIRYNAANMNQANYNYHLNAILHA